MKQFTHRGRITSLHGTLLPPKKQVQVKKYVTMRFIINGTIPSKKNMIWADNNLYSIRERLLSFRIVKECVGWLHDNLKSFIRNSKKYQDWVEITKPVIEEQANVELAKYEKYGVKMPLTNVSIKVYHYWKDNIERDNSNKYDSIIDLFVACNVLKNDCWQVVQRNESEAECYHGEILDHITTIDVTVRLF